MLLDYFNNSNARKTPPNYFAIKKCWICQSEKVLRKLPLKDYHLKAGVPMWIRVLRRGRNPRFNEKFGLSVRF